MSECQRCYVSGLVQGVFFRASTQQAARRFNVQGWAINLPDGRVEVVMCGGSDQLGQLYKWLQHGPPLANVTHVICEPYEGDQPDGFSTR